MIAVIDHAQAHPGQAIGQRAGFTLAGDQHRLVDGVGDRQRNVLVDGFEAVGAAQQIDLPVLQSLDGGFPGGEAVYLDGQPEGAGENARVVRRDPFVVTPAGGDIEGRIIR